MNIGVSMRGCPPGAGRAAIRRLARHFMEAASREVAARPWAEVSVAVLDDEEIRRVNRAYLGHDAPTDVLSFVYDPTPGTGAALTGEILVNAEQAVREARRRRIDPSSELARYIAHGCQHLCGATDRTGPQRERMNRRETAWLRTARGEGYLDGLLAAPPDRRRTAGRPAARPATGGRTQRNRRRTLRP